MDNDVALPDRRLKTRPMIIFLIKQKPMTIRQLVRYTKKGQSTVRESLRSIPNLKRRQSGTAFEYWVE